MNDIDTSTDDGRTALNIEIARRLKLTAQDAINWDWANEIESAMTLPLPGDRIFMELRRWDEGFSSARVWDFPTLPHHSLFLDGQTAAIAWCKAWLAWHDAKSAKLSLPDTEEREDV